MTETKPANDDSYESFQPGDGATYSIGSDSYPVTVRKVSPSGACLWTSADRVVGSVFVPQDVRPDQLEKWTRRANGRYKKVGGRCGFLTKGRSYHQDRSF